MTPEQEAREEIDDQLHQTGWAVQSADEMDISAARGVAVREFPLETGFADYLLYADAKALGTIEAKPEGHTLTGVEPQSAKYSAGLPAGLPHYHLPLPFAYESTGSGHAVHQPARSARPQPRDIHVPSAGRTDPPGYARIATPLQSVQDAGTGHHRALECAGRIDPQSGTVAGPQSSAIADPDGHRLGQDLHRLSRPAIG